MSLLKLAGCLASQERWYVVFSKQKEDPAFPGLRFHQSLRAVRGVHWCEDMDRLSCGQKDRLHSKEERRERGKKHG